MFSQQLETNEFYFNLLLTIVRYLRTLWTKMDGYVFLSADSSPQHGWNLMSARATTILWPADLSEEAARDIDITQFRVDRNLIPSVLGYGKADLSSKAGNVCCKLLLEAGSIEVWNHLRYLVKGYTSDQGVDYGIIDAPLPQEACTLDAWRRTFNDIVAGKITMESAAASALFIFPEGIGMPDHIHMSFSLLIASIDCSSVCIHKLLLGLRP